MKLPTALAGALLLAPLLAQAGSVTVRTEAGTGFSTSAITGDATGDDMNGLRVTGTFVGGVTETLIFSERTDSVGSTAPGGFSVKVLGNTISPDAWRVTTASGTLATILLEGAPGDTVFDISPFSSFQVSTPGSRVGRPFSLPLSPLFDIVATYANEVRLTGDAPVGDLYEELLIDLSGFPDGGLTPDQELIFQADTDLAAAGADITPDPIPLPASLPLVVAGMCAFGLLRARREG